MPKAHRVFAELLLLGDAADFAGGAASLADVMVAPELDFFRMIPEWGPLAEGRSAPCRLAGDA